jgi:hypothetical protein
MDIGTAYHEAYTSEKEYIISGPEFGDHEGHILIISRALCGLQSSGDRWRNRFANSIIEWFSKKQANVETATYGSEFVAARICVEQIIDLGNTV